MRLKLQKLQAEDEQARKTRAEYSEGWDNINGVLHHQSLFYVPEIIRAELISRHHNDPLVGHFGIEKTRELIARKYYWPILHCDVKDYVRGCDICLALKTVRHKLYSDLQSLPIPTHYWKNSSMDFVTGLPILTDWKRNSYNSILVIVDQLTKIVYYKLVKVTINALGLVEIIINVLVRHHGLPDFIVNDRGLLFTSKFWSLLCFFLGIKQRISTTFHPQINKQIKRQNSTMEAYFQAFVNFEQNDWIWLLLMAEFAYNNVKNASTGFMPFELNCKYHLWVSYEKDLNPRSQSKTIEELSSELWEFMTVCQQNLYYAQELQKQAHNKFVKPRSYASGDKVWLSSNHLKTKRNCKLEAKFLGPFQVLHPISKQAYKLELPKKWRIHDIFHVCLLKQDITKKGQVNDTQLDFEFKAGNNKEYEVNGIWDSAVYAKESTIGQLPGLYYLVLWKGYLEEKNTWEPALAIQYLRKLIIAYHKDNPKKPTVTSAPVNTAPLIARPSAPPRPTTKPTTDIRIKRKQGQPARSTTTKRAKKS